MELTWYLADLVTEVRVEGTDNSIVHFDLHLLRACVYLRMRTVPCRDHRRRYTL